MKRPDVEPSKPIRVRDDRHAASQGGLSLHPPHYGIALADRPARENRTGIPDGLKHDVEALSGIDLSDVRVHRDSPLPRSIRARAYAQSPDIHLGHGQERHLGHELWHVVQQRQGRVTPTRHCRGMAINTDPALEHEADVMGARATATLAHVPGAAAPAKTSQGASAVLQGYFELDLEDEYEFWHVADDKSLAVLDEDESHQLYAKKGKAATANAALNAVGSGIELIETNTRKDFGFPRMLHKIEARNPENGTRGDAMAIWADCGRTNAIVVGGLAREAVYRDPRSGEETRAGGDPEVMKTAIMKAWLDVATRTAIYSIMGDLWGDMVSAMLLEDDEDADQDAVAEAYWTYYNGLDAAERDPIDALLGINRYAIPEVGQGYTMSSGGDPVPDMEDHTWNFHWGGVVMTSDDGVDKVVLENYAVGDADAQNERWNFALYGTAKDDQTFHERHKATHLHGLTPTTMVIAKRRPPDDE